MFSGPAKAGQYTNFAVSIYIPVSVVQSFDDPQKLADDWNTISRQLKVDKVYVEVQRDRRLASDDLLERVMKPFIRLNKAKSVRNDTCNKKKRPESQTIKKQNSQVSRFAMFEAAIFDWDGTLADTENAQ